MTATLAEKLAFQLFYSLDLRVDVASIEKSVLTVARAVVNDQSTAFTESYFYEEAIFYAYLVIEAEDRFGYVSRMIELYEQERNRGDKLAVKSSEVCLQLIRDFYVVATERMALCGISPTMVSEDAAIEYIEERRSGYGTLVKNALTDGPDDLQMQPWAATILTPADTPLKTYLSHVVGRLASAVGCEHDPLLRGGLELAVTEVWMTTFTVAEAMATRRWQ